MDTKLRKRPHYTIKYSIQLQYTAYSITYIACVVISMFVFMSKSDPRSRAKIDGSQRNKQRKVNLKQRIPHRGISNELKQFVESY